MLTRILVLILLLLPALFAQRVTISLDGSWNIADSVDGDTLPAAFDHNGPVPGLTNLARPEFPLVDQFDSRELIHNRIRQGRLAPSTPLPDVGVTRQARNYFWYRRSFRPPQRKQVAILKVNKAQFGTAVWLNGRKIGEHPYCFSAGYFNLTEAIRWDDANDLVIRIGAHPGVLPKEIAVGTDFEKIKWTPGIYDSVSLILAGNPVIETVQVAPRIVDSSTLIQSVIHNYGPSRSIDVVHAVQGWPAVHQRISLARGETKTVQQTLRMPGAKLWSPEEPNLYTVETSTVGDAMRTRFGMREFRFDPATKRAVLNGKPYFLRGSNITFHRFLEDPKAGDLPWRDEWVRKLLVEIPKKMHWNSFRFCIGPVPDHWLEIADEAGLLIQNEFFMWTGGEGWSSWHDWWSTPLLIEQYKEWVRDNWNHPSVALWDASNETVAPVLGAEVIPAVRKLDLSNRPWENGYNPPSAPGDPVEDHPYLFSRNWDNGQPAFSMTELERMTGSKTANSAHPTAAPVFINEYGWLWVNRDGSPTLLTEKVYAKLLGPNATKEQRIETDSYLLAGLTEFWRAHRNFAGVLHFVYLTCSYPGVFTSDHFRDVEKLELHQPFADYVAQAFQPLGVYINFWQPKLKAGTERRIAVMMVNDYSRDVNGSLNLTLERGGATVARWAQPFALPALGAFTYTFDFKAPEAPGAYLLKATARHSGEPTVSRRKLEIQ
jgi:beta-galactosidase